MRSLGDVPTLKSRLAKVSWYPVALIATLLVFLATSLGLAHMSGGASPLNSLMGAKSVSASDVPLLPGETLWGAWPNYLFGTNDTQNWDPQNSFETEPAIQQELKADHFPFIRTWFFQKSLINGAPVSDAEQLTRMQADENAGMTCLGELPTENTMAYDEHIVKLMKGRCKFYEFMNEPDIEGVDSARYVAAWKSEIPRLRAIDPKAKFGGPADYNYQGNECTYNLDGSSACFMQKVMQGMATSGVLPDFITFHWYPCWQDNASSCMANATSFASVTQTVKGWVRQYFHKTLPVGITEWNADPSAPMPDYTKDATWMTKFTQTAVRSMQAGGLSFANQFDLANAGGYLTDDMVDIYHNGAPKAQYLAMKSLIAQARAGGGTAPATQATPAASATTSATATPTAASPTQPPSNGALVFSDGFESGNTSAWSKVSAAPGDSVKVTPTAAHAGSYGLAVQKSVGAGDVSVGKTLSAGLTTADLSFALRMDQPSGQGQFQIAELLFGSGGQYFLGGLYIENSATGAHLEYYDGAYKWHSCTATPSYGAWHTYDLRLVVAGDATGSFSLTLDGATVCSASGIATAQSSANALTGVALGSINSDTTIGMNLAFDDVRLRA